VNKRGYLIDEKGNVVDAKGRKLFDHFALSMNGEFPKIFPFSKFNIDSIMGDCEIDPLGNPIVQTEKKKNGEVVLKDNKGRRVNIRGYLIDDQGNVVD